jgi:hypothetical protein
MSESIDDLLDPTSKHNMFPFRRDVPAAKRYRHEVRMQHLADGLRHYRVAMSDKSLDVWDRADNKEGFAAYVELILDGVLKGWPVPPEEIPLVVAPLDVRLGLYIIFNTLQGEAFSQADAAKRLGVTPAAISKVTKSEDWGYFFERGKHGSKRSKKKSDLFSLMERYGLE